MFKNKKWLLIGLLGGVLLTVSAQWSASMMRSRSTGSTPGSKSAEQKIETIDKLIQDYYLYDVKETDLTESMYAGLVNGVDDPYSCYYTAEEYTSISETTEGHYQGIGVVMIQSKDTGLISVAHCYEGSPAQGAGILDGDIISQVDGESLDGKELTEVAALIKANGKDTVHLTLLRGEKEIQVDVTKAAIEIPVVDSRMLDEGKGYIAIYQFTGSTAEQFQAAYQKLQQQGMKQLVVDLRDNPGGLLSGVCDTLDAFMPAGLLVYTEDKYNERIEYKSKGKNPIDIPLVVLINENSASAAEIFAGAVQDHKVGTLIGTTTFGKGIVQKIFTLTDGSAVKLTISSYFTPNGVNIHGKGITPDITVENPEVPEGEEPQDLQLQRAMEVLGQS